MIEISVMKELKVSLETVSNQHFKVFHNIELISQRFKISENYLVPLFNSYGTGLKLIKIQLEPKITFRIFIDFYITIDC